ncbi:MAG: tetratricopeptide repeat protein [Planctomycetes bacterium]|nr:tetratricopeptide repeat protein [Planctomycetota bacterium]
MLAFVVGALTLAAYGPTLSAQALCFDDEEYLVDNRLVQNPSWSSTGRFLTEVLEPSSVGGYYQPISMISLMLDVARGGRAGDLRPFHQTSLALHVINTVLVIVFLHMLFGSPWVAALVGLLFGVHPVCVESVAWVAERKTLLATFFSLCSLIGYVAYVRKPNWQRYGLCLLMYVLALLSKPTSTPLPVLLLLLDAWPLRRLTWRGVLEKVPLIAVGALAAVITVVSQGRTASVTLLADDATLRIPLMLCHNIVFYLHKFVWPADLSPHYPFPEPLALSHGMVLAGVVGTVVLLAVLLVTLRRTRAPLVGWLFFFVALLPTTGIVGFTNVSAADRFVYLPAVGLLLILAWALRATWERRAAQSAASGRRALVLVVVLLLAAGEGYAARRYLAEWRNTETLYRRMIRIAPLAPEPQFNLGNTLRDLGRTDEALAAYRATLRLNANHLGAHNNLATALIRQSKTAEAIVHWQAALQIKPDSPTTHHNLGLALARQNDLPAAITHFRAALDLAPNNAATHYYLGLALQTQGQGKEAVAEYRAALRLEPGHEPARRRLDVLLNQPRQTETP